MSDTLNPSGDARSKYSDRLGTKEGQQFTAHTDFDLLEMLEETPTPTELQTVDSLNRTLAQLDKGVWGIQLIAGLEVLASVTREVHKVDYFRNRDDERLQLYSNGRHG